MLFKLSDAYVLADDSRSHIMAEENTTKYTVDNPGRYHVLNYLLDKGIIPQEDNSVNRCDNVFEIDVSKDKKIVYFIELKTDSDVSHGFQQLESTIRLFFEQKYRNKCPAFVKAMIPETINALTGDMIRLRLVSSRPQNTRNATHGINTAKRRFNDLEKLCRCYGIAADYDTIMRASRTHETV